LLAQYGERLSMTYRKRHKCILAILPKKERRYKKHFPIKMLINVQKVCLQLWKRF